MKTDEFLKQATKEVMPKPEEYPIEIYITYPNKSLSDSKFKLILTDEQVAQIKEQLYKIVKPKDFYTMFPVDVEYPSYQVKKYDDTTQ